MDLDAFEHLVTESLERLPTEFKDILTRNGIAVIVRERMPRPVRRQYPRQIVYGIFIGVPYGRFVDMQEEPTRIELYKESFERSWSAPDEISREVLRTVVHEVGHYFGFTERQIRRLVGY
jgi:predicted Zn-dependent protease with MMP-like domain